MEITKQLYHLLSQRYLLALMCMFGIMTTTLMRMTFVSMMKDLIYQERDLDHHAYCPDPTKGYTEYNISSVGKEEFYWGSAMQLKMLSGHPLGYAIGRFPAGLAIDVFGAKTLFGYSVFMPAIIALMTPLFARTSPYVLLCSRVLEGFFVTLHVPAISYIAARWFPAEDLSFMLAIMNIGFPFGCIVRYYIVDVMFHISGEWASAFYTVGTIGVIYSYVWQAIIWDDPFEHPYITDDELELMVRTVPMYVHRTELQPGWTWPWRSILLSGPLWTLSLANAGYFCFYNFVIVIIPVLYFPQVHDYNFDREHDFMSLVYALMGGVMLTAAIASDKLVKLRMFNITHITKTYYGLSTILGSVIVLGVTHSSCMLTTIFLYFFCSVILLGIGFNVYYPANITIAPNFVGIDTIVTSLFMMPSLPVQYALAKSLTKEGKLNQWKTVSYMFTAFSIVTTALFLKWGNCQRQRWNDPRKVKIKEKNVDLSKGSPKHNITEPGVVNDSKNASNPQRPDVTEEQPQVNEESHAELGKPTNDKRAPNHPPTEGDQIV